MTAGGDNLATASAPVRQSLEQLLTATAADPRAAFGYTIASLAFGEAIEVVLEKAGASFVLWLRRVDDEGPSYRKTARFKVGYRREPADRLGLSLIDATCAQLEQWERSLSHDAYAQLFAATPLTAAVDSGASLDAAAQSVLVQASFSPIYKDWLPQRERQLAERLAALKIERRKQVLLVNATKGLQLYPSIVDFFATLQRVQSLLRVTSSSYFEGIFQFHEGVVEKGVPVTTIDDLMRWSVDDVNRYDVVLMIGPSDAMARLMTLPGLKAKLVLLDLGFYHQLIDAYPGAFVESPGAFLKGEEIIRNKDAQINRVINYSCQPEAKISQDLAGACKLDLVDWRWFNYIPIGFAYCKYYRSDKRAFDVALLGSVGRDYTQIDPDLFRGVRFLFIGSPEAAPEIGRLRGKLDITVVSRVNEDVYARLLASCRCVLLPFSPKTRNVLLSVMDTLAIGKPLVIPRHPGFARLENEGAPALYCEPGNRRELFQKVDELIHDDARLQDIEARSQAFAKEHLDIYRILGQILDEQIL